VAADQKTPVTRHDCRDQGKDRAANNGLTAAAGPCTATHDKLSIRERYAQQQATESRIKKLSGLASGRQAHNEKEACSAAARDLPRAPEANSKTSPTLARDVTQNHACAIRHRAPQNRQHHVQARSSSQARSPVCGAH